MIAYVRRDLRNSAAIDHAQRGYAHTFQLHTRTQRKHKNAAWRVKVNNR